MAPYSKKELGTELLHKHVCPSVTDREVSVCAKDVDFLSETSYLETVFQIDQEGWVMLGSRERNCTGYCFIRMHG